MKYQKAVRTVLCLICMSLAVSLTGCGISFAGFRFGGEKELVFSCREGLSASESGAEAAQVLEIPDSGDDREDDASSGMSGSGGEERQNPAAGDETPAEADAGSGMTPDGRVNINTAGMEELMTLNGIGETRAKAIMEYRTKNGSFTKAEDIMRIPGIKEGIYSKIRDQIIVQ